MESLKPWSVIDTDINRPLTKYTKLILGVVPLTEFNGSFESVYEKNENIYIEKINEDNEYLYIAVVCLRNEEEDAYAALASVHFSSVNFKDLEGSPEDNSILIKEQLGQISDKRSELADKLRRAAEKLPDIEKAYDIVNNISNTFSVRERLLKTNNTFILEGWCPVKRVDEVNKLADKYGCYCEFRDPEDSEEPPILLKNNAFAAPFESVTAMYALPTYRGLDPDFVMAPFYFILFGLMLGDAGYGAIISIACFLGLKLCHFREGMRRNLKMFFLCGLSTVFWGIMFGSFFGDVIPVFSETFLGSRANFNPVWFSPIDQPLTLLVFSFGIGYLHIMCGLLMKAFMLIRDKKVMDAIFDVGFWVLVLTGLPLFALAYILGLSQLIVNIGLVITVIGVAGLIFTQGRDKKNPVMKLLGGIMSLYDITGFVSDILSYSRVLALGLSTSIIGSVFNKLATLLGGGIPGFILFTVIFLLGSALNIALNTLGSYVHASRLQFIEFFSKFYESGGRPYEALKVDTKYSEIK